jgi:hypothetical protein
MCASDAGEHERPHAEVIEQGVERGREERRMLGLEDEVVVLLGSQALDHRPSPRGQRAIDDLAEIQLPAAPVVSPSSYSKWLMTPISSSATGLSSGTLPWRSRFLVGIVGNVPARIVPTNGP